MTLPPWARVGLVLFVALMVQLVILNELRLWGVPGSVVLVLPVAAGLVAGPESAALVGFASGLAVDVFVTTPFGLTALVWTLVGYVVGVVGRNLIRSSAATVVGLAAVAAPASTVAFALVGTLFGQRHLLDAPLVRIALVGALVAAATVMLVVPPMRWALLDPHDPVHHRR